MTAAVVPRGGTDRPQGEPRPRLATWLWGRVLVARMVDELQVAACRHDGSTGVCRYCLRVLAAGLALPAQLAHAAAATDPLEDHDAPGGAG